VRRDEAKAKEEEEERERRHIHAEQEARTNILRSRARVQQADKEIELEDYTGHINFFQDLEDGKGDSKVNVEHEAEKKAEEEKQEKRIGLLTYLGQSVLENKDKPWHSLSKDERQQIDEIRALRSEPVKSILDPLNEMRKYVAETKKFQGKADQSIPLSACPAQGTKDNLLPMVTAAIERHRKRKHKHKSDKDKKKSKKGKAKKHKHKRHSNPSDVDQDASDVSKSSNESEDEKTIMKRKKLEMMRQQRLKREREEHARAGKLVAQLRGDGNKHTESSVREGRRYNSQFHPELARQH
jgi:hypothetical protein